MCQVVVALEPGGKRVEQGQVGRKDGSLAAGGGVYKHHSGHCRGQWRDFKVENGLGNSLSSARDPCD